jgi:hypothetical protein
MVNQMEQKSKNQIRVILVLLFFGMSLLAMGLGLAINHGFNLYGILGLVMVGAGVVLVTLGLRSVKHQLL